MGHRNWFSGVEIYIRSCSISFQEGEFYSPGGVCQTNYVQFQYVYYPKSIHKRKRPQPPTAGQFHTGNKNLSKLF